MSVSSVCVSNCLKLNSGNFEIFSKLMTGNGSLLQFFEVNLNDKDH